MASDNFGLTFCTKKTEVMHQSASRKPYFESNITIKEQRLKVIERFTNLSSTLFKSWITKWTPDLQKPLADSIGICGIGDASRRQPKSRYTELSFLPPSFMVVKCGQPLSHDLSEEDSWHHRTKTHPDSEVLTRASLPSIYTILMQSQLHWAGHVVLMKDHHFPKKLLYCELSLSKCSQGSKKRYYKTHWRFPRNLSVSPLIAWNIWRRTEKLSNVERKSVKPKEMQQLSCAGNLEKALPHQPLPPSFLILTAEDSPAHRLVSLAICELRDAFLNHKVDLMVLIHYHGQRRRMVWLGLVLWHIDHCRLFNAKSCILNMWFSLVAFYGISAIVGYLCQILFILIH